MQRATFKDIFSTRIMMAMSLGIAFLLATRGNASALPCNIGYVDGSANGINNGNYACQDGGVGDNNDEAADLDGFFGLTGWAHLQQEDTPGGLITTVDIGLEVSPDNNAPSGTWAFDAATWDSYSDIIIVVKDGRTPENIYWSAYHVTSGDTSGDWDTGGRGLSHLTVYGIREEQVPEPTTFGLLGMGLAALGLMRRRLRV